MRHDFTRLLFALLGLSVAAGCDSDDTKELSYAYGPMPVNFTVRGKVTDAQQRPVAGIEVQALLKEDKVGRTLTDAAGEYRIPLPGFPEIDCLFLDIDGAANGSFEEQRHTVRLTEEAGEDGSVELNATLEEKRPQ